MRPDRRGRPNRAEGRRSWPVPTRPKDVTQLLTQINAIMPIGGMHGRPLHAPGRVATAKPQQQAGLAPPDQWLTLARSRNIQRRLAEARVRPYGMLVTTRSRMHTLMAHAG